MNNHRFIKLGVLSVAAGLALVAQTASARMDQHGAAFRAYNAGQNGDIDFLVSGVRNLATSPRAVIAPVVIDTPASTSLSVLVDGSNYSGATTSFTLYAYNYEGTFQSSISGSSSAATYDTYLTLATVGPWSYVSCLATLPANASGTLFGVTTMQ